MEASSNARQHRRARILVVDDEPMVLKVMHRILSDRHDVTTSESAEEALALVRAGSDYELVVCDLMMPEMSGAEFFEELERFHPALAARVVFLSGGALTPSTRGLLSRVPNLRLEKPFDLKQIRALIDELTRG